VILYQPLLLTHICTAIIGLIAGGMSMIFRKGSSLHRIAGNFFFGSMLAMSGCGAYIAAFLKPNIGNVFGGLLTFYLVATAWKAGRRREKRIEPFDIAAFAMVFVIAAAEMRFGIQAAASPTGLKAGYPAPLFFIIGTISMLFAGSDLRMILRGGVEGASRIARHLWRMCLALFMALMSFYPTRARLFPKAVNDSMILYVPHVLLAGATLFWLVRVSGRRRKGGRNGQHETQRTDRGLAVSVAHDGAV
jgi:uncharacterized membrane protein